MSDAAFVLDIVLLVSALAVLAVMAVYGFFSLFSAISFVPYVPSGKAKSKTMLDMAGVGDGSRILEIGSGDGQLCLMAAQRGATALGIEINPVLVAVSRTRARFWKVDRKCSFVFADMWRYRLPKETDAVFVYGWPDHMERLWMKLEKELPPGTIIVSHAFLFPGHEPESFSGNLRLYKL